LSPGEWTGRETTWEAFKDDVGTLKFVLGCRLTKLIVSPVKSEWGEMMIGRWDSPAPLFLLETPRLPTGLEHETKPSSVLDEALAPWILVLAPEIKWDRIKKVSKYVEIGILVIEKLVETISQM
jgi:hypothetical protein